MRYAILTLALLLAVCTIAAAAKPEQAPRPPQAPALLSSRDEAIRAVVPPVAPALKPGCGCSLTGECGCANCGCDDGRLVRRPAAAGGSCANGSCSLPSAVQYAQPTGASVSAGGSCESSYQPRRGIFFRRRR